MNNSNVVRITGGPDIPGKPVKSLMTFPLSQERQAVIDAMQIYTNAELAEWVSHGNCPQLHFTDGRIFVFGPHGVTRLA
ncbi:hypothetical protein [Serratia sp. Se-RSmG]|uniref:hypothetical protein n=1 Tax=Serratia sp. Se-RSmG TaxID=3043307 RepID=UPI0024AEEADA|nr:hypothetical protein [Serratia sp. Se-RSmG]MDI6949231.1 hypothetical protein [Serratia sp. Se-RSmG]